MMKQETIDRIRKFTEDRDWDHPRGRMEGWRDGGRYE